MVLTRLSREWKMKAVNDLDVSCPIYVHGQNFGLISYFLATCYIYLGLKETEAQYFYSLKTSYNALYEASQMFCFD